MLQQIAQKPCLNDYHFVHDGDIADLSPEVMSTYFGGELEQPGPAASCAYKHILLYQEMINNDFEIALVLEDDIYLDDNFCNILERTLKEIRTRKLQNFIISLEDSNLKYVKGSERRKGQLLYKKTLGRMTGAYLIDKACALQMQAEWTIHKCNLPIDWFHNHCAQMGLINILWLQPTIAIQGSLSGKLSSTIDHKKTGRLRVLLFQLTRLVRKLIHRLS
jgi:glycosyl transferase family 25